MSATSKGINVCHLNNKAVPSADTENGISQYKKTTTMTYTKSIKQKNMSTV